jgi:hypothetical protein
MFYSCPAFPRWGLRPKARDERKAYLKKVRRGVELETWHESREGPTRRRRVEHCATALTRASQLRDALAFMRANNERYAALTA